MPTEQFMNYCYEYQKQTVQRRRLYRDHGSRHGTTGQGGLFDSKFSESNRMYGETEPGVVTRPSVSGFSANPSSSSGA